jgi:glycosyltransferase involved in cell wall biosynthesis
MLSIIIPFYNEKGNVPGLLKKFQSVLAADDEVVCVDDGSTDGTFEALKENAGLLPGAIIVRLKRNFGQTSAIEAGLRHAKSDIIIIMDGDGQNDPSDIPMLVNKLNEGYDVVSGWRKNRKDNFFLRKIPSYIGNRVISFISGIKLRDYGCAIKVYRKEVLKSIQLWGELHRILPVYAALNGARVTEVEVTHHRRAFGVSKYTVFRGFKLLVDLITAKFMGSFATRPNYLFGIAGLLFLGAGALFVLITVIFQLQKGILLSFLFLIIGFQLLIVGLFSEILMRMYYLIQQKPTYLVREIIEKPEFKKVHD